MIDINNRTVVAEAFPNGESFADIDEGIIRSDKNTIKFRYESDLDLMMLKYVTDFIHNSHRFNSDNSKLNLLMPYVPYSRMDRKENNRLFTLKSVADFINNLGFDSVEIWEPHSDVCVALLNKVHVHWVSKDLAYKAMMEYLGLSGSAWLTGVKSYDDFSDSHTFEGLLRRARESGVWMVYPDDGAEKRYTKQIPYERFITCSKHRDFDTGKITSIKVHEPLDNVNRHCAIIVDDLCSKGGTFVGVADELKKMGFEDIRLCVTHCENNIFNGKVFSSGLFKKVYTTDSILNKEMTDDYSDHNVDGTRLGVYRG